MFISHIDEAKNFETLKTALNALYEQLNSESSKEAKNLKKKFKKLTPKRLAKLENIESEDFQGEFCWSIERYEMIELLDKAHDLDLIRDIDFSKYYKQMDYYDSADSTRRLIKEIITESIRFSDLMKPYITCWPHLDK